MITIYAIYLVMHRDMMLLKVMGSIKVLQRGLGDVITQVWL